MKLDFDESGSDENGFDESGFWWKWFVMKVVCDESGSDESGFWCLGCLGLMTFWKVKRVTREGGPKMAKIQYGVKPDIFKMVEYTFIQTRFHPTHFHPNTISSNEFLIQWHFQPITGSSKKNHMWYNQ